MDEYTTFITPEITESHPNNVRVDYVIPGVGTCPDLSGYVYKTAMPGPSTSQIRYLAKSHVKNVYYGEDGRTNDPNGLPFRMTRYEAKESTVRNLEYRLPRHTHQQQIHTQHGTNWRRPGYSCGFQAPFTYDYEEWNVKYNQVVCYMNEPTPQTSLNTYVLSEIDADSFSENLRRLQTEVSLAALTSWDALTDIAEIREVPELALSISSKISTIFRAVVARNPRAILQLASAFTPKALLKHPNRAFRQLGDQWMEYRYGLMPLIYSYRDLCKTIKRGTVVREHKYATQTPTSTGVNPPGSGEFYTVLTTGFTRVGASVIQRFSHDSLARLAGMGFSLPVTAWELIPLSFVADWVYNFGEYITAKTSSSFAAELYACTSRRDSITRTTYKNILPYTYNVTTSVNFSNPWVGAYPVVQPRTFSVPGLVVPVKVEQEDYYTRTPFDVRDVPLRFNPSINWRRAIDGAVLSITNLQRLCRMFSHRPKDYTE